MKARIKATWIAGLCGLPFVLLASALWCAEAGDSYMGFGYVAGDKVFSLGFPLTALQFVFGHYVRPLSAADHWWAIPVMSGLFLLQWIIWAQVIVTVMQFIRRRRAGPPPPA